MSGIRWRASRALLLPSQTAKPSGSLSMGLSITGVGQRHWLKICSKGARKGEATRQGTSEKERASE